MILDPNHRWLEESSGDFAARGHLFQKKKKGGVLFRLLQKNIVDLLIVK